MGKLGEIESRKNLFVLLRRFDIPLVMEGCPVALIRGAARADHVSRSFGQLLGGKDSHGRVQVVVITEDSEGMERKQQVTELGEIDIFWYENHLRMFPG